MRISFYCRFVARSYERVRLRQDTPEEASAADAAEGLAPDPELGSDLSTAKGADGAKWNIDCR
jgi:hypothetical protein